MAKRGGARPGSGRKKGSIDRATAAQKGTLEELARRHTTTALQTLVRVATSSESDSAAVTAASVLLDRGYGKPRQAVEHTGANGGPIMHATEMTDAELIETIRSTRAADPPQDQSRLN